MQTITAQTAEKSYFVKPWYYQPWFIVILFALFFFVLPPIAGVVLVILDIVDTFRRKRMIRELNLDKLAELDMLEKAIAEKSAHNDAIKTYESTQGSISKNLAEQTALSSKVSELDSKLIKDQAELEMQEYGFFTQDFTIGTPAEYKSKMITLQNDQKMMVKNKTASKYVTTFQYNGSSSEGRKMVMREVKIALWAFNTHCDNVIANVTYRNRAMSERKIRRALEIINENEQLQSITSEYLKSKLDELDSTFKYKLAVEKEKELLREQREKERDEKKLQQEIATARAKINKDETHVLTELARLKILYANESADKSLITKQVAELQSKLAELNRNKESIDVREANATAGYVYIISNIGAFGEGVVKIGVTRRLEPLERIKELGDASVPFVFDVHALIFSDQAFKLEHDLHERFKNQRLNLINYRKEFFMVPLVEVQKALVEEFDGGLVTFEPVAEAREYRETLALK